jgi:hypothetical protein
MKFRLLTAITLVLVILFAGACSGDDADPATTSPATTTTTASTTTTNVPAFSSDDALSVTDAYFEAYNAGDVEAVLALFEPDATISNTSFGSQTRAFWEELFVWNAAQGTVLSPPDCRVTAEVSGVAVTVFCPYNHFDALVQAVDGPPVPINLTLTVAPDGISDLVSIFGPADFGTVGEPFDIWMAVHHPEDLDSVGFGTWTTVDEAEESGILTARYAAEWATYLNDNGCDYSDGC